MRFLRAIFAFAFVPRSIARSTIICSSELYGRPSTIDSQAVALTLPFAKADPDGQTDALRIFAEPAFFKPRFGPLKNTRKTAMVQLPMIWRFKSARLALLMTADAAGDVSNPKVYLTWKDVQAAATDVNMICVSGGHSGGVWIIKDILRYPQVAIYIYEVGSPFEVVVNQYMITGKGINPFDPRGLGNEDVGLNATVADLKLGPNATISRSCRKRFCSYIIRVSYLHDVSFTKTATDCAILPTMLSLGRAALRVFSSSPSKSTSFASKSQRSITSLTNNPVLRLNNQRATALPLQRRWASEEVTQSEPEADGATEASQGDNSIAASATSNNNSDVPEPAWQNEGSAVESAKEKASKSASAASETATDTASSTTESISSAAQTAKESVVGAAQSLGAAAGFRSESNTSRGNRPFDREEREPTKTVYIGNLFFDIKAENLKREFERAGEVVDSKIIMDPRGMSKGFGYVEFKSIDSATRAIELYNLQTFEGRRLSVQYTNPRSQSSPTLRTHGSGDRAPNPPTKTLFIGNMSFEMSDRDLNNLFREIRNVVDVRVAIDRRTGQPRGFAHADFVKVEDAEKAYEELRGKEVMGRTLRVDFSTSTGRAAMPMPGGRERGGDDSYGMN